MPTTPRGYPHPDGSAKLGEMDLAIKALAEKVDSQLKVVQSGLVLVTGVVSNIVRDQAVNFDFSFLATPNVVCGPVVTDPSSAQATATTVTPSNFVVRFKRNSSTNTYVYWIAHG